MKTLLCALALATPFGHPTTARADDFETHGSVMAGLNQWVLFGGGNIAGQLQIGRLALEVSHGQSLHLDRIASITLTDDERAKHETVEMTWTTGFGIGVNITPHLHALVELKAHHYLITGEDRNSHIDYVSATVGPGLFYDLYLYDKIFIQPSIRWWPTVASTYDHPQLRRTDGSTYTPSRYELLPFVNVNVGYTF